MSRVLLVAIVIASVACSPTDHRVNPPVSGDNRPAPRLLKAMKEPQLDSVRFTAEVYRFTYAPSFQPQALVRLVRDDHCRMVRKQARQRPEADAPDTIKPGTILPYHGPEYDFTFVDSMPIPRVACGRIAAMFDSLRMPDIRRSQGVDGEGWIFERFRSGTYEAAYLWSPPQQAADSLFVSLGRHLLREAGYENGAFRRR